MGWEVKDMEITQIRSSWLKETTQFSQLVHRGLTDSLCYFRVGKLECELVALFQRFLYDSAKSNSSIITALAAN